MQFLPRSIRLGGYPWQRCFIVWRKEAIPQKFKDASIIHLYKRKGNPQVCDNHSGISLVDELLYADAMDKKKYITGMSHPFLHALTMTVLNGTTRRTIGFQSRNIDSRSDARYHYATALPIKFCKINLISPRTDTRPNRYILLQM